MEPETEKVSVVADVHATLEKVWELWNAPEHITQWYYASDDWHTPEAQNDLSVGGRFRIRMEARDGNEGFDLDGTYTAIEPQHKIEYALDDARMVTITFTEHDGIVRVAETFDPEHENPIELQQAGWQAILDNFRKYVESQ